jgi:hypothetical protein
MSSFELVRSQNTAAKSFIIVWTAILYWDWLATLPLEVPYIWRAKTTPLKIIFLLQRYGTILFHTTAAVLILSDVPPRELSYSPASFTGQPIR